MEVLVSGRIDTITAPDLEKEIRPYLDGITDLILDFQHVNYVSSAGLRTLLLIQKIMLKQGNMKIVGVNDIVNDIFEVTGFSDILTIEKGEA